MKKIIFAFSLLFSLFSAAIFADAPDTRSCSDIFGNSNNQSSWVTITPRGQLSYRTTEHGDQIMDFSHAGYGGGGKAFPNVPNLLTVQPSGADDTSTIQNAINQISSMPLQHGVRGAVLLAPGIFTVSQALTINASGVVLRGSGNNANGTQINLSGDPHVFLHIQGDDSIALPNPPIKIIDAYVPSGAMQIHLDNVNNLNVGDSIFIQRPATQMWIDFLGMQNLCPTCIWMKPGAMVQYDRVITAISPGQKLIILDAPIPDSLDSQYLQPDGATVVKYSMTGRINNVGFESLTVNAPTPLTVPVPFTTNPTFSLLQITAAKNVWAQNITGNGFITGVLAQDHSKWITLQDFAFLNSPTAVNNGPEQFQYYLTDAQLFLCNRCTSSGSFTYSYVTGAYKEAGPNVILNSIGNDYASLEPHMRWSTGLLVDNFKSDRGGIDFISRGTMGTGHGWTMAWGVIWNSTAKSFGLQQPPGSYVWAIGDIGNYDALPFPNGGPPHDPTLSNSFPATLESWGNPVTPRSLYLAQLCVRSGRRAVANLGY